MTDDPIDFEAFKDRRFSAELDAHEAHWWGVVDQLIAVLLKSEESDIGMTSATLRALLEVLHAGGMSRLEALKRIADALGLFRLIAEKEDQKR